MKDKGVSTVEAVIISVVVTGIVVGGVAWLTTGGAAKEAPKKEFFSAQEIGNIVENQEATGQCEIYHWWTAGAEEAAISAGMQAFGDTYSDVTLISSPVSGGAGVHMKEIIQTQVSAHTAPESFQSHAGYEVFPYIEADALYPLDNLWESLNLEDRTSGLMQSICSFQGHYYQVPNDIHRVNNVWYNMDVFEDAGVDVPDRPVSLEEFWNLCETLKNKGYDPLALGDANNWTLAEVFEQFLFAKSPMTYQKFVNGNLSASEIEPVLTNLDKYLGYVASGHKGRNRADAAAYMYNGDAAMFMDGDWTKGWFANRGWKFGEDFGVFRFPGTKEWFDLCVDAFVTPKYVNNRKNSIRWNANVTTTEFQEAFNPPKGSVSPYNDVPKTIYDEYGKRALKTLNSARQTEKIYPSIAHGSGSPPEVGSELNVLIGAFSEKRDVGNTAQAIADLLDQVDHPKTWEFAE